MYPRLKGLSQDIPVRYQTTFVGELGLGAGHQYFTLRADVVNVWRCHRTILVFAKEGCVYQCDSNFV